MVDSSPSLNPILKLQESRNLLIRGFDSFAVETTMLHISTSNEKGKGCDQEEEEEPTLI